MLIFRQSNSWLSVIFVYVSSYKFLCIYFSAIDLPQFDSQVLRFYVYAYLFLFCLSEVQAVTTLCIFPPVDQP